MIDALTLFYSFWFNSSFLHPPPVIPTSLHLNSLCTFCLSIIHRAYHRSHSRLFFLSFLFPPPPSLATFQFRWIKLSSLLCHSSNHYVGFLPSHFNSRTPLIPLSSFPQHTMYLPLPLRLSTTVFNPLTSLSSLIFLQPFPCLYTQPSISSLPAFFLSSTHTQPSIRQCVFIFVCTCATVLVCVCVCFLSRARCSLLRRLEWWRW